MNRVDLTGRITTDPEVKFGASGKAYVKFNIAINRDGDKKSADYPTVIAFGKTAELIGTYVKKGRLLGVVGRLQTSSYERDGRKIYSTEILADRIEFLWNRNDYEDDYVVPVSKPEEDAPEGFTHLDDDIPF